MKLDSSADLVTILVQTQLLEAQELEKVRQAMLPKHSSATEMAAELVEARQLTAYQTEQILDGRGDSLVIEGYRILEPLGQGGMGQVFKAEQARLGRIVALKVINQECLSKSPESVRRFQREARAAAQLSHPNVITIHDAGQSGDTHYIVMEYAEGIDLDRLVRQCGPLPIPSACEYIRQAALGLQHAHERGLIHRDIKPSNVLITQLPTLPGSDGSQQVVPQGGVAKVLDLGLARLSQAADRPAESALTEAGKLVGTPDYIAPEQARNARDADGRADIYSLGCTFYFILTGRHPFPEGGVIEKLLKHQLDEPEPVEKRRPEVPLVVAEIVRKMMAKQPMARYQTPAAVAEALAAVQLSGTRPPSPPAVLLPPADSGGPLFPTPSTPIVGFDPPQVSPTPPSPAPAQSPGLDSDDTKHGLTPTNSWTGNLHPDEQQAVHSAARELAQIKAHKGCVLALAFAPDRNALASTGVDGSVRWWDFSQGKPREQAVFPIPTGEATSLIFAPNQKTLVVGTSTGKLICWDFDGTESRLRAGWAGHQQPVTALDFSADGRALLSGGADRTVHLWDLDGVRPNQRASLSGLQTDITAVAFAPDAKTVAAAGNDGTVRIWEPRRFWNRAQTTLRVCKCGIPSVAFAADGRRLVCATSDRAFRLWEIHDSAWQARPRFGDVRSGVRLVMFRPEVQTLVTVEDAGRASIWEPETGALLEDWTFPVAMVYSYALTCDARYLAVGRSDGKIIIYRIGAKRSSG